MIILHDVDLIRAFREEFAQHADKFRKRPILSIDRFRELDRFKPVKFELPLMSFR